MLFDVIVGNPPYQGVKSTGGVAGKPPTIWTKFVLLADTLLKDDGVMVMVHPAQYRKPGHPVQEVIYRNNRQLHIYNNAEAMYTFGASTRYDWYVLDRTYTGPTRVYFEDGSVHDIQLEPGTFLPNGSWNLWSQYSSKTPLCPVKMATTPNDKGDYKVIQTLTKTKGVVVRTTDKQPKSYGIPKVVLSESGVFAFYDKEGEYGTSSNCYHIPVKSDEEADEIMRFVESPLCHHLVSSCLWSNFRVERILWTYLSTDVIKYNSKDIEFVYGQNRYK